MMMLMKKRRERSRNDDRRGARDFALWTGIGQMSRAGSGWVRQDAPAGLGRQVLWEQVTPIVRDGVFETSFTPTGLRGRGTLGGGRGASKHTCWRALS